MSDMKVSESSLYQEKDLSVTSALLLKTDLGKSCSSHTLPMILRTKPYPHLHTSSVVWILSYSIVKLCCLVSTLRMAGWPKPASALRLWEEEGDVGIRKLQVAVGARTTSFSPVPQPRSLLQLWLLLLLRQSKLSRLFIPHSPCPPLLAAWPLPLRRARVWPEDVLCRGGAHGLPKPKPFLSQAGNEAPSKRKMQNRGGCGSQIRKPLMPRGWKSLQRSLKSCDSVNP